MTSINKDSGRFRALGLTSEGVNKRELRFDSLLELFEAQLAIAVYVNSPDDGGELDASGHVSHLDQEAL